MDPMGNEIIYNIYIDYRYQYTYIMTYMMNIIYLFCYYLSAPDHCSSEIGCPCACHTSFERGQFAQWSDQKVKVTLLRHYTVAFGLEFGMTWNEIRRIH